MVVEYVFFFAGRTAARLLLCCLSAPLFIFWSFVLRVSPCGRHWVNDCLCLPTGSSTLLVGGGGNDEDGDACVATCGKRRGGRTRRLRPRPCMFESAEALL